MGYGSTVSCVTVQLLDTDTLFQVYHTLLNYMIVLCIRDHEGLGFFWLKYHSKNQPHNTFMAS